MKQVKDSSQIDSICDSFEAEWVAGKNPNLEEWLSSMSISESVREQLLPELVRVDLEYRLRAGDSDLSLLHYVEKLGLDPAEVSLLKSRTVPAGDSPTQAAPTVGPTVGSTVGLDTDIADKSIGGHILLKEIGRGGMGVVYLARSTKLGRLVALKTILGVLQPNNSPRSPGEAEAFLRFERETQAAAQLIHPNIIPLLESGEENGRPWFTMEFIDGKTLSQRLRFKPIRCHDAAEIILGVATGLTYAHENGVVHRDVKPSNILIDQRNVPRLSDFGLAKLLDRDASLTDSGDILGTLGFMSPEQARGAPDIDARLDVYSAGAVLYRCLTGRAPFQASDPVVALQQIASDLPVPPKRLNREVDDDINTICLKCLEKQASKRYQSAAELAHDLKLYLSHKPILARPVGPVGLAARWLRRHPLLAACTTLAAVLFFTLAIGIPYQVIQQAKLRTAQQQAKHDATEAAQQTYFAGMAAVRESRRRAKPGWTWLAHQQLETLAATQGVSKDQYDLRSLAAAVATTNDWQLVSRFADGFDSADVAVDRTGRFLAIAEIRARGGCRVQVYEISRDQSGQLSVVLVREWSGSPLDGTIRNAMAAIGLSKHNRAEGFRSVCFSPNGKQVVAGSRHGEIWIWDFDSSENKPACHMRSVHSGGVGRLAISTDNRLFALSQTGKDELQIHDKGNRTAVWKSAANAIVSSLATTQSGEVLFSQGRHLYRNFFGGDPLKFCTVPNALSEIAVNFDGTSLLGAIAGTGEYDFGIYNTHSGRRVRQLSIPRHLGSRRIHHPVFAADDTQIIAGLQPNVVGLWDGLSGEMVSTIAIENKDKSNVAWLSKPQVIAVADGEGVGLYEVRNVASVVNHTYLSSISTGATAVADFDISDDGKTLYALDSKHGSPRQSRITSVDLASGERADCWTVTVPPRISVNGFRERVPCLSVGAGGEILAACHAPGCWIRLDESGFSGPSFPAMPSRIDPTMDGSTARFSVPKHSKLSKHASLFLGLAINTQETKMDVNERIQIRHAGQSHSISAVEQHQCGQGWQCHFFGALGDGQTESAEQVEVIFPGRLTQQSGFKDRVHLLVAEIDSEASRLGRFRFVPGGDLAYVDAENTLHRTESLEETGAWAWKDTVNNSTAIRDIAASRTELLVGTRRGQLFRFDASGKEQLLSDGLRVTVDHENRNEIVSIAVDKRLTKACVGKRNGDVIYFDLQRDGDFQRETYRVHDSPVTCIAMSPDGKVFVSADDSGFVQFWRISETGLERSFELDTLASVVSKMKFTPDGSKLLILCRGDSGIRILELNRLQHLFRKLEQQSPAEPV